MRRELEHSMLCGCWELAPLVNGAVSGCSTGCEGPEGYKCSVRPRGLPEPEVGLRRDGIAQLGLMCTAFSRNLTRLLQVGIGQDWKSRSKNWMSSCMQPAFVAFMLELSLSLSVDKATAY